MLEQQAMSKNRKYDSKIEPSGTTWKAQIIRHITSKKTVVSKQQDGFSDQASAQQWAEQQLLEFTATLSTSNERHGQARKQTEEQRRQRSNRRAEKTDKAKLEKLDRELESANEVAEAVGVEDHSQP